MCEYSVRNEILAKLFHKEKASKGHPEKQPLYKAAMSLGYIMRYSLATTFSSEHLLSNACILTFHKFAYRKETKSSYNGSIFPIEITFFCILSLVL